MVLSQIWCGMVFFSACFVSCVVGGIVGGMILGFIFPGSFGIGGIIGAISFLGFFLYFRSGVDIGINLKFPEIKKIKKTKESKTKESNLPMPICGICQRNIYAGEKSYGRGHYHYDCYIKQINVENKIINRTKEERTKKRRKQNRCFV